jgi:hypothetical protein
MSSRAVAVTLQNLTSSPQTTLNLCDLLSTLYFLSESALYSEGNLFDSLTQHIPSGRDGIAHSEYQRATEAAP